VHCRARDREDRIVTHPARVDLPRLSGRGDAVADRAGSRQRLGIAGDPRVTRSLPGRLTEWKPACRIEALADVLCRELKGLVLVLAGDPQGRAAYVTKGRRDPGLQARRTVDPGRTLSATCRRPGLAADIRAHTVDPAGKPSGAWRSKPRPLDGPRDRPLIMVGGARR